MRNILGEVTLHLFFSVDTLFLITFIHSLRNLPNMTLSPFIGFSSFLGNYRNFFNWDGAVPIPQVGGAAPPPREGLKLGIFPGTAITWHREFTWNCSVSYSINISYPFNCFLLINHYIQGPLLEARALL